MDNNFISALLAILPILLILFLMIGRGWGAARAGAAGYLAALVIAFGFFGFDLNILAIAQSKALVLAIDVLLIIWAAFLFYKICDEAGAIRTIAETLPHLTADRVMQALLIGWVFASFLQGVGGFGVPVAVTAPILASLGISPFTAVVISSIGHGWAVNFGSLGSSFQALIASTGMPAEALAPSAAIFLGVACVITGPMVAHVVGGWPAVWRSLIPALAIGFVMASVQYFMAVYGSWNIAALTAAMAGLLIGIPLVYLSRKKETSTKIPDRQSILLAFAGYLLLILIVLSAQLVHPITQILNQLSIQFPFPETVTNNGFTFPASTTRKISLFGHPGALLLFASFLTYVLYRIFGRLKRDALRRILIGTSERVMPSSVSILSLVSMSVIMEYSGMTDAIAVAIASFISSIFPLISPWIGALGAFMTGSNTNSNLIFGGLQKQTAEILGFSLAVILAAQTSGGSIGSTLAPAKVVVGTGTTRLSGNEGEVIRRMLGYTLFLLSVMSLLTVIGIILTQ